jgi:hypothetical protein
MQRQARKASARIRDFFSVVTQSAIELQNQPTLQNQSSNLQESLHKFSKPDCQIPSWEEKASLGYTVLLVLCTESADNQASRILTAC